MSENKNENVSVDEEFAQIEKDERLKGVVFSQEGEDAMFAEIAKIRAEALKEIDMENKDINERYKHLTEEERGFLQLGKEVAEHEERYVRKRGKKMMLVLAAALVLSMAMGTVGITSRYKELQLMEKQAEDMQYRFVDSEIDMEESDDVIEEREAKAKVEEFFGQPVLWLHGLEVLSVECLKATACVDVLFTVENRSVAYQIVRNENKVSNYNSFNEIIVSQYYEEYNDLEYFITIFNDESGKNNMYRIEFDDNEFYYFITIFTEDSTEIENILKNIQ